MAELGEPWRDDDAEYEVLTTLLVPAAQAGFARATQDWNALDTKALGVLALDAAVIAGLVAVHNVIHSLWWLPAAGCAAAGALFVASIWPRTVDLGPDLIDFHDEMRESPRRDVARSLFTHFLLATETVDETVGEKTLIFWVALGVLSVSLVGCLPIVLLRP
jgi:hypothetical protein